MKRSTILSSTVSVATPVTCAVTHARFAACALRPDLALLSDGDMTEVGEKGITVRNIFETAYK
jgi:hypothetical protein